MDILVSLNRFLPMKLPSDHTRDYKQQNYLNHLKRDNQNNQFVHWMLFRLDKTPARGGFPLVRRIGLDGDGMDAAVGNSLVDAAINQLLARHRLLAMAYGLEGLGCKLDSVRCA